jgi:hypothetical protein
MRGFNFYNHGIPNTALNVQSSTEKFKYVCI